MPKLNGDALKRNLEQNGETQDVIAEILTLMTKMVCPSVTFRDCKQMTRRSQKSNTSIMTKKKGGVCPSVTSESADKMKSKKSPTPLTRWKE